MGRLRGAGRRLRQRLGTRPDYVPRHARRVPWPDVDDREERRESALPERPEES